MCCVNSDVVIVGAGIGGLTLAIALRQRNMSVQVLEQASSFSEVGAGIQLSPNAMKAFVAMGLGPQIAAVAFTPQNAVMRHHRTGQYIVQSPLGKSAESRYGAPYLHIHRADLHAILVDSARNLGVILTLNAQVVSYQQSSDSISIELTDKTRHDAWLLVGADGIHSTILSQMRNGYDFSSVPKEPSFSGQVAWRGVIPTSTLPANLVKPDACVWVGPKQHLVTYYIRGGDWVNFVAVQEGQSWSTESWRAKGAAAELQQAFAEWHPEVTQLLSAVDETFKWGLFSRPALPRWHEQRVVLLGDACHPMLPFMAQGAAMAIEDAFVLASELSHLDNWRQPQLDHALVQYTQKRLSRTKDIQRMSASNTGLYHLHGGPLGECKLHAIKILSHWLPVMDWKLDPVYGYDVLTQ